jgi:hypothetical protein
MLAIYGEWFNVKQTRKHSTIKLGADYLIVNKSNFYHYNKPKASYGLLG